MYFETCFTEKTLDSFTFEVLCHAIDEHFDGVCKRIEIYVHNDYFVAQYDAGMSLEIEDAEDGLTHAEKIMTWIYVCRNGKKHLAVGEEFCRLGLATINYAAERCELVTVCNGAKGRFIFENGIPISREIGIATTEVESTQILMKPDKQLFEGLGFTLEGIKEKAKHIISMLPNLDIRIINQINPPT